MSSSSSSSPPAPASRQPTIAEVDAALTSAGSVFELQNETIKGQIYRTYKNLAPSIRDYWLGNAAPPETDYIVYEDERYTYGQVRQRVAEIANLLRDKLHCKKGDHIAIASRNYPEWICSFWAIHVIGAVAVLVNAWVTPEVLEHCIAFSEAKVVFCDSERAKVLQESKASQRLSKGGVRGIFVFRPDANELCDKMTSFDKALLAVRGLDKVPDATVHPEDTATILFTSGTTGLPKGVVSSQRQFLSGSMNALNGGARAALRRGEEWPPSPGDNPLQKAILVSVPLFHATGCQSMLVVTTGIMGKIVMQRKWNVQRAVDLIVREKVTSAGGLALIASELLNSNLTSRNHSLEQVGYGGGPASKMLAGNIPRRLGSSTSPNQGYGATETNATAVSVNGEDYIARPTSTGLASLVVDLKIVDPNTGHTLTNGEPGEIYMRGANVASGYWKNPKATAEVFLPDGFYRSGDIGRLDNEGFLHILDRAKDIIIRGGENIASVVVENALYEDSRLGDVAVIAVPDTKYGEVVGAIVVPHPQHQDQVTERQLIDHVAARLPKHMIPAIIHVSSAPIPRNANGKALKRDIKQALTAIYEQRVRSELPKAKL